MDGKNLSRLLLMIQMTTLLLFAVSCTQMPEGNPEDGERWFRMNRCNGCHGEKGSGGIGPHGAKGPVIAGLKLNYRKFIHKLRNPDSAVMPSFSETRVSDKDAADIFLWLKQQKK